MQVGWCTGPLGEELELTKTRSILMWVTARDMATQVGARKRGNPDAKLAGHQMAVTKERGSRAKLL